MLAQRIDAFGMTWAVLVLCAELAFFGSRVHALHAEQAAAVTEYEVATALERDLASARGKLDELRRPRVRIR